MFKHVDTWLPKCCDAQLKKTRRYRHKITDQQLPDRVGFGFPLAVQKTVTGIESVLFCFSLYIKRGSKRVVDRCYKITSKSNMCKWNHAMSKLKEYFGMNKTSAHDVSSVRNVKQSWTKESVDILKKHRLGKNPIRFKRIAQILNDIAVQTSDELGRFEEIFISWFH